jgi:hypothetical protein
MLGEAGIFFNFGNGTLPQGNGFVACVIAVSFTTDTFASTFRLRYYVR